MTASATLDPILPFHLQVFATAVLVSFIAWVAHLVRHDRLSLRESLLWLLSTVAALVATLAPSTLRWLASALGIAVPTNALDAVAFDYVLLNLLSLTTGLSVNAARTRRLAQECAVLRAELDRVRARLEAQEPEGQR